MERVMEWDNSLNTGIDIIDKQHQGIVEFINKLHTASHNGDREIVGDVLTGLINYTVSHFAFEEDMHEKHGYPLAAPHKKVHEMFVEHVASYQERHNNGEDIARKLSGELVVWLGNHIKNEDKDYVPYCSKPIEKGVLSRMLGKYFK
ncbi:MAG: bacteriohemerythrin [Gammaproteobacteria bacterium]|nr:bacteriohemerythrin [Gammaproteobacteria bacterium]